MGGTLNLGGGIHFNINGHTPITSIEDTDPGGGNSGATTQDHYVYVFDLTNTQTFTVTGNLATPHLPGVTEGWVTNASTDYASLYGAMGSFTFTDPDNSGDFIYTVDRQALLNYGISGINTLSFSVTGDWYNSEGTPSTGTDTDHVVFYFILCFAEGSLIGTPGGETPVERLAIGDLVTTADGRSVPVKSLGRRVVSPMFNPAERWEPVRLRRHALGENSPHSDLTVTADHALLIDGVLCHAGALVNGGSVLRVPFTHLGESYTVFHVETETHEIILANGAPAETFIDNVSRRAFDNYAEFEALYGDVPEMQELPYPRAMSVRQVPGDIHARLAAPKVA